MCDRADAARSKRVHTSQDAMPQTAVLSCDYLPKAVLSTNIPPENQQPTLIDLPPSILATVAETLVILNHGNPRDVVSLAVANKKLWDCITDSPAMEKFWKAQCERMGWSLDWVQAAAGETAEKSGAGSAGAKAWLYFCERMRIRWRLRRILRRYKSFLSPLSAAALLPPASVETLRVFEESLCLRLPCELFELYRWAAGQEKTSLGSIDFLNGARLLTPEECVEIVQHCTSPSDRAAAFNKAAQEMTANLIINTRENNASAAAGTAAGDAPSEGPPEPPDILFPFTTELRGRKQYCIDIKGVVWLRSGFHTLHVSNTLAAFLHLTLI